MAIGDFQLPISLIDDAARRLPCGKACLTDN